MSEPPAAAEPITASTETTQPPEAAVIVSDETLAAAPAPARVQFNEFLPNPVGADSDGEFFELFNLGGTEQQLRGWRIETDRGKSFAFGDILIGPGQFHAFTYAVTKLALVNDALTLTLYDESGAMIDSIRYPAPVPEGKSYAFIAEAGQWQWTAVPTPGGTNQVASPIIPVTAATAVPSAANDADDQAVLPAVTPAPETSADAPIEPASSGAATALSAARQRLASRAAAGSRVVPVGMAIAVTTSSTAVREELSSLTELAELTELEEGTEVRVQGIVTLPTGRLGKSLFALQDPSGGAFVRIYGTGLPILERGVRVDLTGKLVRSGGSYQINTSTKKISRIGRSEVKYIEAEPAEIDAGLDGSAVAVSGTVMSKGSGWLVLGSEDGAIELKATLPRGVVIGPVQPGDRAQVRGVVRLAGAVPQLILNDRTDLAITPAADSGTVVADLTGGETGVQKKAADQVNGSRQILIAGEQFAWPWYAPVISFTLLGGGAGLIIWRRRRGRLIPTEELFDRALESN